MEKQKVLHAVKIGEDQGASSPIEGTDRVVVDHGNFARVHTATPEQIKAAFAALGLEDTEQRTRKSLTFHFAGTDTDVLDEIGEHTVRLHTLVDVMDDLTLYALAQRKEELPQYGDIYGDMHGLGAIIKDEAEGISKLASGLSLSCHEAKRKTE